ncbi:MAG: ABC transporter substrate-binding protein [Candidatus Tectomicrobia bacterium]|nr:ABC transporter substrate-binding protein [Candidatus Tectomicrobia bacterium]
MWSRLPPILAAMLFSLSVPGSPSLAADKVTLTQPVDSLSFFPIYVGRAKGFFQKEGLELDVKATAGGGPHLTAVFAGKAEFTASPGTYQINALNEGKKVVGFVDLLHRNIIGMVIHKEAAAKVGIKPGMPLMERVKRAKGLTVGITRPGALTDDLARNIFARAGLKVPDDVRIISAGGAGTMLPALRNRKIDIITISTPHPETILSENIGMWFVNWAAGEDPAIKDFMMSTLMASPELIREKPDLVKRMTRAVMSSLKYINETSVDQLTKDMTPFFGKSVKPAALRISVETVKAAVNPTGKMSDAAVATTFKLMKKPGKLKNLQSLKRSDVWTDDLVK